ncbi:hypothetical protein AK812_SmicGene48023 [Symbiodinium microadriaticum]|uniref:Uncharacterized protein n=1 Tax=Symbiodinium microadriaticum TaxID=2951 RepID=A0A1Q9BQR8_SYMMI|nr:hypothetical protein AK812_SmicGene48023 [Symbiodinium microadriaticum]
MIAAHRDEEKQAVQQIRQWLCEERKDWFTLNQLKTAKSKFVFNFNKQEVQNVIENMVKQGKMISAPITLPKVGQTTIFLPTYSCEKALGDVVPVKHDQNLVFTEEYNVERVCSRPSKKKGAPKRNTTADVDDVKLPQLELRTYVV